MTVRFLSSLMILLCCAAGPALALNVEGVRFDERIVIEGVRSPLFLNGAGVRTKFTVKVYAIGLYLPQRTSRSDQILQSAGAKRVSITALREITSEQFIDALQEKLRSDLSSAEAQALQGSMDQISEIVASVGSLKRGEVVALDYLPGRGTRVVVNGQNRGAFIASPDFYRALLSGWVGAKPVNKGLKEALLGTIN